ncbi:MAG TPA: hydrolase 1, exosortase A system-associated [Allosphingosinicella sp.]|nr:hydrolase 1, exosortase A system-associated [Allosphingosinicella sp.]
MGKDMRRLLSFPCEGARLGASLDEGVGPTGILMVTGGSQTRVGSHRMYERLADALAGAGYSSFRFDRRGVGDSEGEDPGFRGSAPDVAAAAAAFRSEIQVSRVIGFGLCDGATSLAFAAGAAGLDGMILVNPWFVEAESGAPAPAAVRAHYKQRLLSVEGWKKLLTGSISWRKLLGGLMKSTDTSASPLAAEAAAALRASGVRAELILASGDATAVAAANEVKSRLFKGIVGKAQMLPSDSHTFAREGDADLLTAATLTAIKRLGG